MPSNPDSKVTAAQTANHEMGTALTSILQEQKALFAQKDNRYWLTPMLEASLLERIEEVTYITLLINRLQTRESILKAVRLIPATTHSQNIINQLL